MGYALLGAPAEGPGLIPAVITLFRLAAAEPVDTMFDFTGGLDEAVAAVVATLADPAAGGVAVGPGNGMAFAVGGIPKRSVTGTLGGEDVGTNAVDCAPVSLAKAAFSAAFKGVGLADGGTPIRWPASSAALAVFLAAALAAVGEAAFAAAALEPAVAVWLAAALSA